MAAPSPKLHYNKLSAIQGNVHQTGPAPYAQAPSGVHCVQEDAREPLGVCSFERTSGRLLTVYATLWRAALSCSVRAFTLFQRQHALVCRHFPYGVVRGLLIGIHHSGGADDFLLQMCVFFSNYASIRNMFAGAALNNNRAHIGQGHFVQV